MKDHKDLEVWKKSVDLVADVYQITRSFPKEELYGLTSQMRRAAISIPSNLSEGAGRQSMREFLQFLYIALGSATELETQLIISERLEFLNDRNLFDRLESVKRLLNGLIRHYKGKLDVR